MTALHPLDLEKVDAGAILRQHTEDGTAAVVLTPREIEELTERLFELMTRTRGAAEMASLLNRLTGHHLRNARRTP